LSIVIRLATDIEDIRACTALEHHWTTDHVWQMDAREQSDGMQLAFRSVRLPRTLRARYPRSVDELSSRWENGEPILVAEDGDRIVGYLHLILEDQEGGGWARNLAVASRQRRRGIGTALLQAAANWLRQRNLNRLTLEMTTKNYPAICLAQKLGFGFCGYNDRYYASQDIALFFSKSLR